VSEASVAQGKATFSAAWWPLHLMVALAVLALFAWSLNVYHRYHPLVLWNAFKHGRAAHGVASK
jgi:lipopolysaccharide export system permease protein